MYCPECEVNYGSSIRFCIHCGTKLIDKPKEPPMVANRYKILKTLKQGGMGCVYKAEDTKTDEIVAIKKMLMEFRDDQEAEYYLKRFREEALILFKLNHKSIPKAIDFFTEDDPETKAKVHYFVMSFIEGPDLESIMDRRKAPLTLKTAIEYFVAMLDIMAYLHGQTPPILYRDLKPSNIIIKNGATDVEVKDRHVGGELYIVDFGIARTRPLETAMGTVIGTEGYAAPEQYTGRVNEKSDIYTIGVVMHYLLTGLDPQRGSGNPFDFKPIRSLNPNIPAKLESIIMPMLDMKPARRPESAKAILDEVLNVFGSLIKTDEQPASAPSAPQLSSSPPKLSQAPQIKTASAPVPPSKPGQPAIPVKMECVETLDGMSGDMYEVAFSPKGDVMAACFHENIIGAWDTSNWDPIRSFPGHTGPVRSIAYSPDGLKLASASEDGTILVWDAESGKALKVYGRINDHFTSVDFSPDGNLLAAGATDNQVYILGAESMRLFKRFDKHHDNVLSVLFFPKDMKIISSSKDGRVLIWKAGTGQLIETLENHLAAVRCANLSLDHSIITTASDDQTVCLWDAADSSFIARVDGFDSPVCTASLTLDNMFLITGEENGTMKVWDLETRKVSYSEKVHDGIIHSIVISPDGWQIVTSSSDGLARVWKMKIG